MKKLRWAMDGGGFWDLDVSTPRTLDGSARPVPAPGEPLPLGLSRGTRLSRPKQIDFMQRFMSVLFVPSYSPLHGFALHRVLTIPIPFSDSWIITLLGQFNLQRFVSSVKGNGEKYDSLSSWLQNMGRHLRDKSLYALSISSDVLLTPDDTVLVSLDTYGDNKIPRKKATLHHKFPNHDLTVEAVSPGLFVDKPGNYWEVPFSMAIDLASTASDSGASYRLSVNHNAGLPSQFQDEQGSAVPAILLPGLLIKSAFSFKKHFDIWTRKVLKSKRAQPYDVFLSNPHISASGIIGAAVIASVGNNSVTSQTKDKCTEFKGFYLRAPGLKSAFLADIFACASFSAQYGNFQRMFLDLTRLHARLDFPCGSKFLICAAGLVEDLLNSQQPRLEAVKAALPDTTFSFQQQIAGPISFRVDSGVSFDLKNRDEWRIRLEEPVFALEYALQVLGSAKAIAWYSPKQREFMVELRFFET